MSLPEHYQPCPVEWMTTRNQRFTICEVLREIYDRASDREIQLLCRVAMNMAKRMNNKLMEYNATWQEVFSGKTEAIKNQIGGYDGGN